MYTYLSLSLSLSSLSLSYTQIQIHAAVRNREEERKMEQNTVRGGVRRYAHETHRKAGGVCFAAGQPPPTKHQ
jgi:hypothetical protein